ncbi:MAG: hypothetical protein U0900_12505 [Myxococcota bacterium]
MRVHARVQALVLAAALAVLGTTSGPRSAGADEADATVARRGGFEIRPAPRRIGAGGFPNVFRPFARQTVSEWTVRHRGEPVRIATADGAIERFDEAWFLEGTEKPAVLAAAGDFFLIAEARGRVEVVPIAPGQGGVLATWQWLDAKGGQPDEEASIGLRDRRGEPRSLAGGTLLLLDGSAVLEVATRRVHPVRAPLDDPALARFGVAGEPARALSPDRTRYVLAGSEAIDGRETWALVVVDYRRDGGTVVPFDPAATGVESVWDVTPAWLARHFTWQPDAEGALQLVAKPGVAPPRDERPR